MNTESITPSTQPATVPKSMGWAKLIAGFAAVALVAGGMGWYLARASKTEEAPTATDNAPAKQARTRDKAVAAKAGSADKPAKPTANKTAANEPAAKPKTHKCKLFKLEMECGDVPNSTPQGY